MNDEKFHQTDIDRDIDRMNAREVKMLEREFIEEQRKKLQMQRELRSKMDMMMQTHHSSMMGQYGPPGNTPMDHHIAGGGANSTLSKPSKVQPYNNDSQLSFLDEDKRIELLV